MVKSAKRACQILTLVGQKNEGLSLSEISKSLQIPFSSASGLLATLAELLFLSFDSKTQKYTLGSQILSLTGNYLDSLDLVEQSRAVLKEVVAETGEFTAISVRTGMDVMFICKEESPEVIHTIAPALGARLPMYATSSGKVILAFLPKQVIEKYLSSVKFRVLGPNTITESEKLRKELEDIRSSYLAFNREEFQAQIVGMAAPLFDLYGDVVASIVVSTPVMRFNAEKESHIRKVLKKYSILLSKKMGFKSSHPAHV